MSSTMHGPYRHSISGEYLPRVLHPLFHTVTEHLFVSEARGRWGGREADLSQTFLAELKELPPY
jgi:hypothetical protein